LRDQPRAGHGIVDAVHTPGPAYLGRPKRWVYLGGRCCGFSRARIPGGRCSALRDQPRADMGIVDAVHILRHRPRPNATTVMSGLAHHVQPLNRIDAAPEEKEGTPKGGGSTNGIGSACTKGHRMIRMESKMERHRAVEQQKRD